MWGQPSARNLAARFGRLGQRSVRKWANRPACMQCMGIACVLSAYQIISFWHTGMVCPRLQEHKGRVQDPDSAKQHDEPGSHAGLWQA